MTTVESGIDIQVEAARGSPRRRLLIALWPRLPSLADLRAEAAAQADRWFLWSPVAMGVGAGGYFSFDREPSLWVVLAPALVAAALAVIVRRKGGHRSIVILCALVAFACAGLAIAKIRTERMSAPIAPVLKMAAVEGWVVDVASPSASGQRILIAPTRVGDLAPDQLPLRLRMTLRDGEPPAPGSAITFRGLINPPPPPAAPGAYDFARNAWFDGVGGVGVALTDLRQIDLPKPPTRLRAELAVNAWRWRLAQRIASRMSPSSRGLGVAMITGHEAWLDQETQDHLRDAGLAHIISISGLHMAIVGGFAFFAVRAVVALLPGLVLRAPGKKIAAVAGFLAVVGYLVVSGAPAPAQRSAITAAVAFGAILFDRRAVTLHSLAIAALIVLTLQPEAVAEPGFQMSFSATAALVALAEAWPRRIKEINTPWPIRTVQRALDWLWISLAASFVAGLATGPFAIQHFNRMAVFGLGANLLTEPLSAFGFMPALAVGSLLEPIGLGGPFLTFAGWGLDAMTGLAEHVAAQPHAVYWIASAPGAALPIAFLGLCWLCLWKGWLRWLGLPAALAVTLWPRPAAPDAWISPDGGAAAVRTGHHAVFLRPDVKRFGAELWAHRRGLDFASEGSDERGGRYQCSRTSCLAIGQAAPRVSMWWTVRRPKAEQLDAFCLASDILVMKAEVDLPPACDGVIVLKPADFAKGGAVEVFRQGQGWRLVWAQPMRGARPWTTTGGEDL